MPPQVRPLGHTHSPLEQVSPAAQASPQAPQFLVSVCSAAQRSPQML
jgi:hypothetical protein